MTMNNNELGLIAHDALDPERISPLDYTNTLVTEAVRVGIFDETDVLRIKTGLFETLSEVIGYDSQQGSTSVRADRAKEFGCSILYNIDAYLLSLGDNNAALSELRSRKMNELYGKGYLINSKRFEQSKVMYARVRYTRLKDGSAEYNKTLDVKLKNYFAMYDARFNAHSKAYVTLGEYGIRGAFRIDQMPGLLDRLLEVNRGRTADVTLD